MGVTGRRLVVVWRLVGALRLLELNSLLVRVVGIVSVVLIKLLAGALGVDGSRSGILWRRSMRRIVRRCGSHPTCSSQRRDSVAAATARVTSIWSLARDQLR